MTDSAPPGKKFRVHGLYYSWDAKERERVKRPYDEAFEIPFASGHAHRDSHALSHLLSGPLSKRLEAKDPGFRGVHTHHLKAA